MLSPPKAFPDKDSVFAAYNTQKVIEITTKLQIIFKSMDLNNWILIYVGCFTLSW